LQKNKECPHKVDIGRGILSLSFIRKL